MSTLKLTAFEKIIVAGFADKAGLAAPIFEAWAYSSVTSVQSSRSLVNAAQLSLTEESATEEILARAVRLGLADLVDFGFVARDSMHGRFQRIAFCLYAIDYYQSSVHKDATLTQVVLTKPPQPSVLEKRLSDLGWRIADLDPTEHAFHGLVRSAKHRVVIMTPFFDVLGATWLQELLSRTSDGVERALILRSLNEPARKDYPVGFDSIYPWLKAHLISPDAQPRVA